MFQNEIPTQDVTNPVSLPTCHCLYNLLVTEHIEKFILIIELSET
jgi:hypothetical protein